MRRDEERELSVYDFEAADPEMCRKLFELYEGEAKRLLAESPMGRPRYGPIGLRLPLRKIYEFCLKCSHLFNILDARGAISVAERVALITRIRNMTSEVGLLYRQRQKENLEAQPA
jgi:glycyl-tRNA synthetase alpha chain